MKHILFLLAFLFAFGQYDVMAQTKKSRSSKGKKTTSAPATAAAPAKPKFDARLAVAIVTPSYDEAYDNLFIQASAWYRALGMDELASRVRSFYYGGSGSGFVYEDKASGKKYVITSKRAVECASSVSVSIARAAGDNLVFTGLTDVWVSEALDLAAIALPQAQVSASLAISSAAVADGLEVFSAGYSKVNDELSWQLAKGTVSNAHFSHRQLAGGASCFIQHTAQVDPGKSGGPLLVADAKSPAGYSVVGLNSARAIDRQEVNFAINA